MRRRPTFRLLGLLALSACQPGSSGPLVPVAAVGVAFVEGEHGPAAKMRSGALTAEITGSWGSQRPQTLYVRYRNDGPTPIPVALDRLGLRHRHGPAELSSVVEITGQDRTDARTDNDEATLVYNYTTPGGRPPALTIAPRSERLLMVDFSPFPGEPDTWVEVGDRVTAEVPATAGPLRIEFECGSAFWPF